MHFHNERTRSTQSDPNLTFWCVSYYLGAFGTVCLPYETRCKMGRTSAKVRATKSRRNLSQRTHPILPVGPYTNVLLCFRTVWVHFGNERTRSTQLDPKLTFCCVSYYLGAFGTVCLPYETRCKLLVPRSRVGIFRNKCTRSTPLDPKLTFCCVSYYFIAFGTVWLPYETRCKTGRASAIVRATKSRRNFSQRTHTILPVGP